MRDHTRHRVNWLNASTPIGLLVARALGLEHKHIFSLHYLVRGYDLKFPAADAFVIGDVIFIRDGVVITKPLFDHEKHHAIQYAMCGGVLMWPLYALASSWSWLRARNAWQHNIFEVSADLRAGNYIV